MADKPVDNSLNISLKYLGWASRIPQILPKFIPSQIINPLFTLERYNEGFKNPK